MISFTGKPGDLVCQVRFSPRPAFEKDPKVDILTRDLVYGHFCPTCRNVIQACFLTEKPIDLWPFEETAEISKAADSKKFGEILKWIPNEDSKPGYSQYVSTFERVAGGNAQHIVLKNHVLRYHGIDSKSRDTDRYQESGGNVCAYTGVFSMREDLMLSDVCLFYRCNEENRRSENVTAPSLLLKYKFGKLTPAVIENLRHEGVRLLQSYGQPLPMLLFTSESTKGAYPQFYRVRASLAPYLKQVKA